MKNPGFPLISSLLLVACPLAAPALRAAERSFDLVYEVSVPEPPEGGRRLDLWIPVPHGSREQSVGEVRVESPHPHRVRAEKRWRNRMVHIRTGAAKSGPFSVTVTIPVTRRAAVPVRAPDGPPDPALYEREFRLMRLDDQVRMTARRLTEGKATDREKARAIYDHVLATMRYDKSGEGWGRGDLRFACDEKRGNCTDFHSYTQALALAAGLPSRFEIGFNVPADAPEGPIAGYHCWAWIYLEDEGLWFPLDASDAWKHKDRREELFGGLDVNRVAFTTGRDLELVPRQKGEPLNFFIYPYAEVDGRPWKEVKSVFSYRSVGERAAW